MTPEPRSPSSGSAGRLSVLRSRGCGRRLGRRVAACPRRGHGVSARTPTHPLTRTTHAAWSPGARREADAAPRSPGRLGLFLDSAGARPAAAAVCRARRGPCALAPPARACVMKTASRRLQGGPRQSAPGTAGREAGRPGGAGLGRCHPRASR